jgi:hypothetical protein
LSADVEIKAPRCPDCGGWHVHIAICPYIRSRTVRFEPLPKGISVEIVETVYFPARMKLAKHTLGSEAEVHQALKEADGKPD